MSKEKPGPALSSAAEAERLARLEREAAALRANLRRRKAQSRAREDAGEDGGGQAAPPDSRGAT